MFDFLLELLSFDLLGIEWFGFLPMFGLFGRHARRKARKRAAIQALTSRIRQADYDMISRVQRGLQIRRLANNDIYTRIRTMRGTIRVFNPSETALYTNPDQPPINPAD